MAKTVKLFILGYMKISTLHLFESFLEIHRITIISLIFLPIRLVWWIILKEKKYLKIFGAIHLSLPKLLCMKLPHYIDMTFRTFIHYHIPRIYIFWMAR